MRRAVCVVCGLAATVCLIGAWTVGAAPANTPPAAAAPVAATQPATLPSVLPASREFRLSIDANRTRSLVHVFEELQRAVLWVGDEPGRMGSSELVVCDLAKGTVQSLGEFAPQLKGRRYLPPDMSFSFATANVLALKEMGEKALWLVNLAKRTAVSIEISDSPILAISGERLLLADPTEGKKGISPMRCYTLDGKQVDFPLRYGLPIAPGPAGKGFVVLGIEDTLSQPIYVAKMNEATLRAYVIGSDGNVIRKSTQSSTGQKPNFREPRVAGAYMVWVPDEEYKALRESVMQGRGMEIMRNGMTFVVENLSDGTTRALRLTPPTGMVVPLEDGRILTWKALGDNRTWQVWSPDGARFRTFAADPGDRPALQGQTLYLLGERANVIRAHDLTKIQP